MTIDRRTCNIYNPSCLFRTKIKKYNYISHLCFTSTHLIHYTVRWSEIGDVVKKHLFIKEPFDQIKN